MPNVRLVPLLAQRADCDAGTHPPEEEKEEESWWCRFCYSRGWYTGRVEYAEPLMRMTYRKRRQWSGIWRFGDWI